MAKQNEYAEPCFKVTYPTYARLCEGRLLFGVRKATEFTVVPAITKMIQMPDIGWLSVVTVIGGSEKPKGLELGGKIVDGSDEFNAFGFETWKEEKFRFDKFTTALVTGSSSRDFKQVEQLELDYTDTEFLYANVALNALLQIERLIPVRISGDIRAQLEP